MKRISRLLDRLFEGLTKIIGSTPVIIGSIVWCTSAYFDGNNGFLDVVSMVTFIFGEFILRGQNVQDERQEKYIKKDVRLTREILKKR